MSDQSQDIVGKSLQLLKETRPGISRMAYLGFGEPPYWETTVAIVTAAAQQLGLNMTMIPITSAADFDTAFAQISRERCDALAVSGLPVFQQNTQKIVSFANEHHLPTLSFVAPMAQEGLLLAYGPDPSWAYRPAAAIVD